MALGPRSEDVIQIPAINTRDLARHVAPGTSGTVTFDDAGNLFLRRVQMCVCDYIAFRK